MKLFWIKIKPLTGFLTPWQADSVFAALCWQIVYYEGEQKLQEFLKPFRDGNPPFLLSDGFPNDLLPAPHSLFLLYQEKLEKEDEISYELAKALKKVRYLTPNEFNMVLKGERPFKIVLDGKDVKLLNEEEKRRFDLLGEGGRDAWRLLRRAENEKRNPFKSESIPHASINRLTGTTGEEGAGGYYELEERLVITRKPDEREEKRELGHISVYVRMLDEKLVSRERIKELFERLSKSGYGKRKSIGKGHFTVEFDNVDFADVAGANGFVSLSNFCPSAEDPTNGFYKTFVKYGKLGEEFAVSGKPFKRPLMMFEHGSVFYTNGKKKDFYGRVIRDIAPQKTQEADVIHYAFALPVHLKTGPGGG